MKISALLLSLVTLTAEAGTPLVLDMSGNINRQAPNLSTPLIAIISSPETPSPLGSSIIGDSDNDGSFLSINDANNVLLCRGSTLHAASNGERLGLCTASILANAIVLEGITVGDVEQGLRHSRHARTLTALFRSKLVLEEDPTAQKSTLLLGIMGEHQVEERTIVNEVMAIFDAVAAERMNKSSFSETYNVVVVPLESSNDATEVLAQAQEAAAMTVEVERSESPTFLQIQTKIRESGVASEALDSPLVAQAFLTIRQAYAKQAKAARAKVAAWKARVSRGLIVDGFGDQAEALLKRTLGAFDGETLSAAGLYLVSAYRLEIRTQLQVLLETSLEELFDLQIKNLEKSTLKKLARQLLSQQTNTAESNVDDNAASMRNAAFAFESGVDTLQIPSLNLVKDKPIREMSSKLTDALSSFPDSPEAQLKRLKGIKKTTSKDRKPSSRAVDLGLDLVAMIRPDGFGSLQGFAGYQLGSNSVTVGVANDADDPQVIAQMGGVRPPLIRIQPKLRVDVEL